MDVEPELGPGMKLKQRVNNDESLKYILRSLVGTQERGFRDGLLFEPTIEALNALWTRLDFVSHDGILREQDFQSVRGIDQIWVDLLDACNVSGDGSIRPAEFVAGFVMAALDKEMVVWPQTTVTGLDVIKGFAVMLNERIMEEIDVVRRKMGW